MLYLMPFSLTGKQNLNTQHPKRQFRTELIEVLLIWTQQPQHGELIDQSGLVVGGGRGEGMLIDELFVLLYHRS